MERNWMTIKRLSLVIGGLVVLVCCLPGNQAVASHPFHVSSAEVHWNPNSGNFEVALCVWPADLEKAISRQQAKSIDLDHVGGIEELLHQYVASRFVVRKMGGLKGNSNQPIRWVGQQIDLKKGLAVFRSRWRSSIRANGWLKTGCSLNCTKTKSTTCNSMPTAVPKRSRWGSENPSLEIDTQVRANPAKSARR